MSGVGEINTLVRPGLPQAIEALPCCEQRILWATVRLAAEKGFESVSVFDVTERARVSRATFYELFESRDDCLFAAYERLIDAMVAYVGRAFEGAAPWPVRIRRALGAALEAVSVEPEVARMAAVDVPAVKPEAQRRYRGAMERFIPLFREGRRYAQPGTVLPPDLERLAVASTEAMIADEVAAGRARQLPTLLPDILFSVLARYLGPEAARAEVRRAQMRPLL